MKKFFRLVSMLAVAGLTLAYTSCTDYSEDIDKLKEENSQLTSTIEQLEAKIKSGCVITGVKATDKGLEITTSDGKTYEVKNGVKGDKGDKGDTGAQGVKGEKGETGATGATGAQGEKGEKGDKGDKGDKGETGATGATGAQGEKGDKGDKGGFYMPNADGHWYYYEKEGAVGEDSGLTVFPAGTITAEIKDGKLVLHNVDGRTTPITLDIEKAISSLVFIPQCIVGGVEGMEYIAMTYNKLTGAAKDSEHEAWTAGTESSYVPTEAIAEYHVNANALKIDDSYRFEFITKDVPYYTKAGAEAFALEAAFDSFDEATGILKVKVTVKGNPASAADKISVFALKAVKNDVAIVSDYATIIRKEFNSPDIAWPKALKTVDTHFKTVMSDVWTGTAATEAECDAAVAFNGTLDLNTIVAAHKTPSCEELTADDLTALGLDWKFEIVKNYEIGGIDQAGFVSLDPETNVITAKMYDAAGNISVGANPIVRVSLVKGEDVVKVAYIKIYIKTADVAALEYELKPVGGTPAKNEFNFTCAGGVTPLATVAAEVNSTIYQALNLTKEQFHTLYNSFEANNATAGQFGEVIEDATHALTWTLSETELFALTAGQEVSHVCEYFNSVDNKISVKVKLTATAADLSKFKTYNVPASDYISGYWSDDLSQVIYNVAVPESGSADPSKCVFNLGINAAFKTVDGQLKLDSAETPITGLNYFFCSDIRPVEVDGANVSFTISADGTQLSANGEVIAEIKNDLTSAPWNTFEYKKGVEIAEKLLNTGKMVVNIAAKGYVCGSTASEREIEITFNGEKHFEALVKQPVTIQTKSADKFKDGVDFGDPGSIIDIASLLDPKDWRGFKFADNLNYWDYYGPFTITFDTANAKADFDGDVIALPSTIELEQKPADATYKYGSLTYKNNGTIVKGFKLLIPLKVKYGWGEIVIRNVEIEVEKTPLD